MPRVKSTNTGIDYSGHLGLSLYQNYSLFFFHPDNLQLFRRRVIANQEKEIQKQEVTSLS